MTQLATIGNAQLPAHIQGDGAGAVGLVTSESVPRISLKDASFLLKKDGNEIKVGLAKPIQVVILGIDPPEAKRTAKQYYEGAWNEDSADAPDCFSNDGVVPDQGVAEPQANTCAQCPKNAWGSGTDAEGNPSKGKACSDRKNLLVVLGGKHIDGDVFRLSVPPTSLKALSTFGRDLVRYNVNMHKIITQIDVDPDNSKGMLFGYAGYLDEVEANRMAARAAGAEVQEMVHSAHALPAPAVAGMSLDKPAPAATEDAELDLGALNAGDSQQAAAGTDTQQQALVDADDEDDVPLDSTGRPWDERIDGKARKQNADGTWRLKKGVSKELVASVLAEYKEPAGEAQGAADTQPEGGGAADSDGAGELDALLDNWGGGV